MSDLLDKVLAFATKAHEGVFRNNGITPYIEHPKAVAKIAVNIIDEGRYWIIGSLGEKKTLKLLVNILSHLHDTPEDVAIYLNKEVYIIDKVMAMDVEGELSGYREKLITALMLLNKHRSSNYLDFVLKAKNNELARIVKLADIIHNVSDLNKGSLKDKYILSRYILES